GGGQSVRWGSKAATRSAGGTKSRPPSLVTFATNSTIACFAFPSFHEASGSAARTTVARIDAAATTAATAVRTWRPTRLVGPAVGGLRLLHRLVDRRTADESPCGSGAKREQSGRRHVHSPSAGMSLLVAGRREPVGVADIGQFETGDNGDARSARRAPATPRGT